MVYRRVWLGICDHNAYDMFVNIGGPFTNIA